MNTSICSKSGLSPYSNIILYNSSKNYTVSSTLLLYPTLVTNWGRIYESTFVEVLTGWGEETDYNCGLVGVFWFVPKDWVVIAWGGIWVIWGVWVVIRGLVTVVGVLVDDLALGNIN